MNADATDELLALFQDFGYPEKPEHKDAWKNDFNEIVNRINQWIGRNGMWDDRDVVRHYAATVVPYLCTEWEDRLKVFKIAREARNKMHQNLIDTMETLSRSVESMALLGLKQSMVERKLFSVRQSILEEAPAALASNTKPSKPILAPLFSYLNGRGLRTHEKTWIIYDLFVEFEFEDYKSLGPIKSRARIKQLET